MIGDGERADRPEFRVGGHCVQSGSQVIGVELIGIEAEEDGMGGGRLAGDGPEASEQGDCLSCRVGWRVKAEDGGVWPGGADGVLSGGKAWWPGIRVGFEDDGDWDEGGRGVVGCVCVGGMSAGGGLFVAVTEWFGHEDLATR